MLVVYDSRTGTVRNFLKDCGILETSVQITDDLVVDEPFVLVTYTTTLRIDGVKINGVPPEKVTNFLERNGHNLVGVAASGDKNWGRTVFARSADIICEKYKHAKNMLKFQKRGTKKDRELFLEGVESFNESLYKIQQ
jgi:protein involved in ribonucleotide reduction